MNAENVVISRHRLPHPYRYLLIALWLTPILMLLAAIIVAKGMTLALFDPRFLLIIGLMSIPAFYVWQEGVDVLRNGIKTRVNIPRYYAYKKLKSWRVQYQPQVEADILTIYDADEKTALSVHTAHLSQIELLLNTLSVNVGRSTTDEACQ
jgi:hypothetical protein